jgi:prolyl oligopeptidase
MIMGHELFKLDELTDVDFPSLTIPINSEFAVAKIKHGDSKELTIYTLPISSLLNGNIPWKMVCSVNDEVVDYAVHNSEIYLRTAKDAPMYKVVRTTLEMPDFANATEVLNIGHQVIESMSLAKDAMYIGMNDGGFSKIARIEYKHDARPLLLNLPDNSSGYVVSSSLHHDGIYISTNSWTKGSLIYKYDPITGKFENSGLMPMGKFDDVDGFTSREVSVKSHDGVMVPLSIIYKSDTKLDGNNPTLIRGYGAYGNSMGVYFNPLNLTWLEMGGIMAVAHVRGGGEYGKKWHQAGQMLTKPNTWKDFIACAEYLITEGYTSKEMLAGQGGSAGGILIGRAITERPDLFAAAIISVGCLDAVRMETTTNGVPNIQEFGTFTNEDGFKGLYEMSSYHHVVDGVAYPAVLLTHGINDPRVEPWMSAKMTARLQSASSSGYPVLFRVEYGAGHGVGSTQNQRLAEKADRWSFLLWQFGIAN